MKSDPNPFLPLLICLALLCTVFLTMSLSCTWEEVKQGGYNAMQEHQTQRCLENPSRTPTECLKKQQSYETYQKQQETTP